MTSPWIRTATGRMLVLGAEGLDINIDDAADMLAKINRFNGATREPYSVAQHCAWVSRRMFENAEPARTQLLGLLHDLPEYIMGDMPTPLKLHLFGSDSGGIWEAEHERIMKHATAALGLPEFTVADLVTTKHYDLWALKTEWRDLMIGQEPPEFADYPSPHLRRIFPHEQWRTAREVYLSEFDRITRDLQAERPDA